AFEFLLGAQLHAEVGELALAALAVLAGAVLTAVHGALRAAPDVLAHTAIDLVFRLTALCHRVLLIGLSFEETRPPVHKENSRCRQVRLESSGKTTGRETQRGPKTAREQAVSSRNGPAVKQKGHDLQAKTPSFRGDAQH